MFLPELSERLARLFRFRRAEGAEETAEIDRELTSEEHELVSWLLAHGDSHAASSIPQLAGLRVCGACRCGCPTVNFQVAAGTERGSSNSYLLADLLGTVNGNLVGVMLFQAGGALSCLEICALSDMTGSFELPNPSTIHPFEKHGYAGED